jgi:hypothetical protein
MQGSGEARKGRQPLRRDSRGCSAAFRRTRLRQYASVRSSRSVGAHESSVYHYFATKEDLLFIAHRRAVERRLLPLLDELEAERDAEKRLRKFIFEHARTLAREPRHRTVDPRGAAARTGSSCRDQEIVASWTQHPPRQHCRTSVGGPLSIRHQRHARSVCGYRNDQLDSVLV